MKGEVAMFWYRQVVMGNKELTLPGLIRLHGMIS